MENYVYVLREEERLESGEVSVYLEGFATEALAEAELVRQAHQKVSDAVSNGEEIVSIDELEAGYAELSDGYGNEWVLSVEPLFVKQA